MSELDDHVSDVDSCDTSKRVVGLTPRGNKIYIVLKPNGKYQIKFFEGGVLPDPLKGEFTSYDVAERAVKIHLAIAASKSKVKTKVDSGTR